jgi:hypothetical protein
MDISIADYLILGKNVNSYSAVQQVLLLCGNQRIHYYVHKSPQLDPVLTQNNPVYRSESQFDIIDLLISPWCLSFTHFSQTE